MTSREPEMSQVRTTAIRGLLAEHIRQEPELRRRRVRRRALLWAGVGVLSLGVAGTGAAIVLGTAPVTDTSIVHCLSSTEPQLDGTYPGSSATIPDGSGPGRVDDALALCSQMWQQGVLDGAVDPTAPSQALDGRDIPALQVCVARDGSAAVVPSAHRGICPSLGMSAAEG